MEFSKLQVIALTVLTTILTDKYLINHNQPVTLPVTPTPTVSSIISPSPTLIPAISQNEVLLKELQNLRKDMTIALNDIKTKTNVTDPLPTGSSTLIGGMVKISSSQWKKLDVYEKASTSSKIISSIAYDTIYFYRQKIDGWFQLDLDGGQSGWVQSQFLKEFP